MQVQYRLNSSHRLLSPGDDVWIDVAIQSPVGRVVSVTETGAVIDVGGKLYTFTRGGYVSDPSIHRVAELQPLIVELEETK
jgi:hypothetical protein